MSIPRRALLPALVFAVAFLTFWPGLSGEFVNWDDDVNFLANPNFRGLGWSNLRWMFTTTLMGHWIPLTWLTLGVNYVLGGMAPWGYHLGNLLLHAANAVVFYAVARRLLAAGTGGERTQGAVAWGAAAAAAVFAVHPLRVESVAWVTERRDVLSGLFFLLAVLGYLNAVERGAGGRLDSRWRAASLGLFAAALLSKASTMMLPAALLVLDIYPLRRRGVGLAVLLREKIGYFALAGVGAAVALVAVRQGATVTGYAAYGLGARAAMTLYSLLFYPWRFLWPVELSPMYELPARVDPLAWRFLLPMVAVPAITAALIVLRRRWPGGLAAWVYSALLVLPVSGAVHAGYQLAHDRYSYLSGLGFNVLAGGGIAWLLDARARGRVSAMITRSATAGAAAALLFLAAASWDQSKVWADSETLWRWAANLDSECAVCWNNLGHALSGQKRHPEAEAAYRRVAALRPMTASLANNIAIALAGQRKDADAEAMLREALRLDPNLTGALLNLGSYEAQTGRFAEALAHLRKAYALDPRFSGSVKELAQALVAAAAAERKAGRPDQAMALYQEALTVQPGNAQARDGLEALSAGRPADGLGR
ncbi:MAG: tetratricopeptide repeat protein [Candidatus Rokubacteria bacterium]|nr:tetratricopeptide repeat protein [Candidatus Rokubacteria bacterium]